jgi:arginine decarboxylase
MSWTVEESKELYNIEGWGIGYFDVNARGHVTVHPTREPERGLDLFDLAMDLEAQGVGLPLLLRFSDILRTRIQTLSEKFRSAMREFGYTGNYTTVYPIKVNQQRHIIEEIVQHGEEHGVGLEVGSKPELQAVLALTERTDHVIICNGYKDEEYVRLALMGQKLGHRVLIVLEKISEVDTLLRVARQMDVTPTAGVRIKLSSTGAGRWSESAGEKSKFGLTASELMRVLDKLRAAGRVDILRMVHFHLGSQIPEIRSIKQAMTEVARYYVEFRELGVEIEYVDVGGGLGVDYDGTRSTSSASVNYSIQEYANDIVYLLAEACRENDMPMPHIISESGRALTAHHALLLINVIDLETQIAETPESVPEDAHTIVHDLAATFREIDKRNLRETYHDTTFAKEQLQQHFISGVLSLRERAIAERIYLAIINGVRQLASADPDEFEDILPEIDAILIDRYFCNFSVFQSLPDSWAIDQLFPIMPIHRLTEEPVRRGTLQDVTCDSDGKIDLFVGWRKPKTSLELHTFDHDDPYILGIFLTGAYQDIMGDIHNLFGRVNEVHVFLDDDEECGYYIEETIAGNKIREVLSMTQYDTHDLISKVKAQVDGAIKQDLLKPTEGMRLLADYERGLKDQTYLSF